MIFERHIRLVIRRLQLTSASIVLTGVNNFGKRTVFEFFLVTRFPRCLSHMLLNSFEQIIWFKRLKHIIIYMQVLNFVVILRHNGCS